MKELYRSERYFKVWAYTVSHCRLLMRSTRGDSVATRIDIHFGGVDLMVLRPHYDGLVIREGTAEECDLVSRRYGIEAEPRYLSVLGEEGDLSSFVVAGPPQWHEDEGAYDEPSWFGRLLGGRMG